MYILASNVIISYVLYNKYFPIQKKERHTVDRKQVGNNIQVCNDETRVISWPSKFKHLLFKTTEGLLRNTLIS